MKKKLAVAGLATVIVICFAITFRNLAPVQDDGYRSPRERAMIKKFDKDGDGELSNQERKEAKRSYAKERQDFIQQFDKDGDGKISAEEKAAAKRNDLQKDGGGKWGKKERGAVEPSKK